VFIGAQTNLPASLFGNMILDVRALSLANSATDRIQVRVLGGTALFGQSNSNPGVFGTIPNTSNSNTIAMYGLNNSSCTGPSQGAGAQRSLRDETDAHGFSGAGDERRERREVLLAGRREADRHVFPTPGEDHVAGGAADSLAANDSGREDAKGRLT
jgi:hypothetical protein